MQSKVFNLKEFFINQKTFYYNAAKVIISAGLIIFLLYNADLPEMTNAFRLADLNLAAACFLLMFLNIFLQYLKWQYICRALFGIRDKRKMFRSLFYGFSAGVFTPARIGEYWGRSIALPELTLVQTSAATFADKLIPLFIILFCGVIAILFFPFTKKIIYNYNIITVFILLIAGISVLFLNRKIKVLPTRLKQKIISLIKIPGNINNRAFIIVIVISILLYTCYILQFAILIAAFSHKLNLLVYIYAAVLIMFLKAIFGSLSVSEIGIREGVSVFVLSFLGETSATAFNAAFSIFIINILFPSLFGLFFIVKKQNAD